MSAIVLPGNKRSFFEDPSSPPLVSKRLRCSSSPIRFSPPRPTNLISASSSDHQTFFNPFATSALLDHLVSIFPDMDKELLERALKECGNDLDSAIKSLNDLRLGSGEGNIISEVNKIEQPSQGLAAEDGASPDDSGSENLPKDGPEWVEVLVSEMASAANIDDARARASRVLSVLEKSICVRAGGEAAQVENTRLKQQVEALIQENSILKRAVAIQHERLKESDNNRSQELQQLKQLVSQYQEQLRTLEVNNYALTMHLKQAQQSSSIPGRFHPDIF